MQIICTFSGGKDSLASLIWVKENLSANFKTVFCDTGWESPLTYQYINDINVSLNLNLITLRSKKYSGLLDLAGQKGRFPSTKSRFCTEELKAKPMIDFILDEINDHCLIIQGIRGGESLSRSKMSSQCRFFKYYFEPYNFSPSGKPKYHTYRKKDVLNFCSKFSEDVLRPVFDWSGKQVIDYIFSHSISPNPLYSMGFSRVGCFPCIMANHSEFLNILNRFPDHINMLASEEQRLNSSFFKPDYIPARFCSGSVINKKGIVSSYPFVPDIIKYLSSKNATIDLFNEPTSCMSFYGICE